MASPALSHAAPGTQAAEAAFTDRLWKVLSGSVAPSDLQQAGPKNRDVKYFVTTAQPDLIMYVCVCPCAGVCGISVCVSVNVVFVFGGMHICKCVYDLAPFEAAIAHALRPRERACRGKKEGHNFIATKSTKGQCWLLFFWNNQGLPPNVVIPTVESLKVMRVLATL